MSGRQEAGVLSLAEPCLRRMADRPHLELLALLSRLPASSAASVVRTSDAENSDGSSELPGVTRD